MLVVAAGAAALLAMTIGGGSGADEHPWHTDIVTTTFWVGEIFDPDADDGSQVISTYDSDWLGSYGGCDGIVTDDGQCDTEPRTAANDFFPTAMTPKQNPFYLDLPFDDLNDKVGFTVRGWVVPWADEEPYTSWVDDRSQSLMKNRWVQVRQGDRECFGQIEDAGPGQYHDVAYVFGGDDARPANQRYNGAGMDVSPAMNGCLGLSDLNGEDDRVDWRFVDADDVPPGPWKKVITTTPPR
ncbi:MAG: hypothetical protein ABW075_01885 [Aeromicrobium sp.]